MNAIIDSVKTCTKCKRELPVEMFSRNRTMPDGLQYNCKDCVADYRAAHLDEESAKHKIYYVANKERIAAYHTRRRYNLTPTQYKELMANGCEVCGSMENLHVDHDHKCCPDYRKTCGNCIRGVLCGNHNTAMGLAHDSIDELMAMISYLMQFDGGLE